MSGTKLDNNRILLATGQPNWPFWFVAGYIFFQVSLLVLGSTPLRAPLRVGAFSVSLAMLFVCKGGRQHPAARWVPLILLCMLPGVFMPSQNTLTAGVAQATLYLATLAPLLWVSGRPLGTAEFRQIFLLLWGFNSLSAATGVLQIYYPGMFQAQLSAVMQNKGDAFIGSLTIVLANGVRTFRPMGLTDAPGGAAISGLNAILFGVGLLFTERRLAMRVLATLGMLAGLFVIFLSHVRVSLVMAACGVLIVGFMFFRRGDIKRATSLLTVMTLVALAGASWAFFVGGDQTVARFATLTAANPTEVYGVNRGHFLANAFGTALWEYPLGAGPGRWGMIHYYFGNPAAGLWAEVMWESWIYDGGVAMMVLYCIALATAMTVAWQIGSARRGGPLAVWGAVVLAYNIAALSGTFSGPVFATQIGLEVWFINACLFNAWITQRPRAMASSHRPATRSAASPTGLPAAMNP